MATGPHPFNLILAPVYDAPLTEAEPASSRRKRPRLADPVDSAATSTVSDSTGVCSQPVGSLTLHSVQGCSCSNTGIS